MFTRNIRFLNFQKIKNKKLNKSELNILKSLNKIKLLSSFKENYNYSYNKKELKKYKKFKHIRIFGMGGSILGSEAIYQFLNHKIKKKFQFINNLNNFLQTTKDINTKKLNVVISKSGNTLETISNLNLILKEKKNNYIFITEKNENYLRRIAEKLKSEIYDHKNYIGGRYSVLSEVGMLPAELMGLNEKKFKRLNYLMNNNFFLKNLISNVYFTLKLIKQKKTNSIILNYDERSENLFKWYQQLISESLGKKSKGILPVISNMPKDNHSTLQLYLDGPKNNFYTFFSVDEKNSNKLNNKQILNTHKHLKNKSINEILQSQKKATQRVFEKKKLPFRAFEVINRNEETLGELFSFFVLETILLGRALDVNPFDQPSVELIKTETKKFLS